MVDTQKITENMRTQLIDYDILPRFLTDLECDLLIELAKERLIDSTMVDPDTGKTIAGGQRVSETASFARSENSTIMEIERKISKLTRLPIDHQEPFQVQHYRVGGFYKPHYDYFDPALSGHRDTLERYGQRVATVTIYLNTVAIGGETDFPLINLAVHPLKGNALYWRNVLSDMKPDELTLHQAKPVLAGEKWIMTVWVRSKAYV